MKTAILLLAVGVAASWASPSQTKTSRSEEETFAIWVGHTMETLRIDRDFQRVLLDFQIQPRQKKMLHLEGRIAADDRLLNRYVLSLQNNLKKHGRISEYDREMVALMRRSIHEKRDVIERFDRFADGLGIQRPPKPERWSDPLSPAAPFQAGDERYNPESGLWERYEPSTKTWMAP